MTDQEIFDKVATHLLTQNERSVALGTCMYRGTGGMKCAIGCLIPDDRYLPWMERRSVEYPGISEAAGVGPVPDEDETDDWLPMQLQHIHDNESPAEWRNSLRRLAIKRGLSPAVL